MTAGFSPGEVVLARDEEWLVTQVEATADGPALSVQGLSELVRGQSAVLYDSFEPGSPGGLGAPRRLAAVPPLPALAGGDASQDLGAAGR